MKTKTFPTERVHGSQIFPFPKNEQTVEENPPCLSWHPFEEKVTDEVKILKDKMVIWEGETENNYIISSEEFRFSILKQWSDWTIAFRCNS